MAGLYVAFLFATTGNTESFTTSWPCQPDHYHSNGFCFECPPGKFGFNCSMSCEPMYYGRECRYTCSCLPELCDPKIGCIDTSTGVIGETVSATSTDVPPAEGPVHTFIYLVLLIVILAIVGCNVAASMSLLWRFTTKFHLPQHQDKTAKESTAQGTIEEVEMSSDAYESPIIPTERQEMRVYTELNSKE